VSYVYWVLHTISILKLGDNTSIKIIDEPFSIHHAGTQSQDIASMEKEIILKVKPKKLSGPPHLFVLLGKCYMLHKESYKYEFCPFHNVTQREQAYRWNSFHGALGVWKEWEIVGNQFTSMLMTDGEPCIGPLSRAIKVFFKCGSEEKIINIEEPVLCQYNLTFETPLACAEDAFLVYPVLSRHGKLKWQALENEFREKELTLQGYEKRRKKLFIVEGLKINETEELQESKESNHEQPWKQFSSQTSSLNDYRLFGRSECIQKYGELLEEVRQLRELLKQKNQTKIKTEEREGEANNSLRDFSSAPVAIESEVEASMKEPRLNIIGKKTMVERIHSRHPKDVRKGRKGDDGTNIKADFYEKSVFQSLRMAKGGLATSRKIANLTKEEQRQREKRIAEEHMKTHRIH